MEAEVSQRLVEEMKVLDTLRNVWNVKSLFLTAKIDMFKGVMVPSVLYGCKA